MKCRFVFINLWQLRGFAAEWRGRSSGNGLKLSPQVLLGITNSFQTLTARTKYEISFIFTYLNHFILVTVTVAVDPESIPRIYGVNFVPKVSNKTKDAFLQENEKSDCAGAKKKMSAVWWLSDKA